MSNIIETIKMKKNLFLIICGMMNLVCFAQEADHFTMRELADQAESASPDDENVVRKIGIQLDFLKGKTGVLDIHQKGVLIGLSAYIRPGLSPGEVKAAEDKRRKVLESYADVPFRQDMDGKELLYFSAGTLGVPIDQRGMMDYAKNSGVPLPLRLRALTAIKGQAHVRPELEQDLIALGQDEINFSADGHVGPRTNKRFYPIREASATVLKKMKEALPGDPEDTRASKLTGQAVGTQAIENAANGHAENESESIAKKGEENPRLPAVLWITIIAAMAGGLWLFLKKRGDWF